MMEDKTYLLSIKGKTLEVPNELKISFLCGVYYRKDKKDKRNVLKKYLDNLPNHRTVLLEKYFELNNYTEIGLNNLYDVETLVGCFSNNVFVIHESLSTAAEIGMLTSNKTTADKTLIIYPNQNSTEDEKISGFIYYAYYFGKDPVLGNEKKLAFEPLVRRSYSSNEKYIMHTAFPGEIGSSRLLKKGIDSFLTSTDTDSVSKLIFNKFSYERPTTNKINTIDYWIVNDTLQMRIHPMALRCLLFSAISTDEMKSRIEACNKLLEVVEALEDELKQILLQSAIAHLAVEAKSIEIELKGVVLSTFHQTKSSDSRKAIGLFVILLQAMDYLHNDGNVVFRLTNRFKPTARSYRAHLEEYKDTRFEKFMKIAGSND